MDWSDPPFLIILEQVEFFDEFTVTVSRYAQALTVDHQGDFDRRYETPMVTPTTIDLLGSTLRDSSTFPSERDRNRVRRRL